MFSARGNDAAFGVASGGIGIEASASILAQDAFGEDRAGTVAGAEKQDVERAVNHVRQPFRGSTA